MMLCKSLYTEDINGHEISLMPEEEKKNSGSLRSQLE